MMKMIKRVVIYLTGLFLVALGVTVSINSGLGVSPVNSLPYVVSLISGKELGFCVTAIFSCYIAVQILLLGNDFQWVNLTQILCATVFGWFVDLTKRALHGFVIPTYAGQVLMLGISIVLVAAGVAMYLDARLINMPMEGMTAAVAGRLFPGRPFHEVKVILDCLVVALAAVLSVACLGRLEGVREGTAVCALLVGRVMAPVQRILGPVTRRLTNDFVEL